MIFGQQSLLNGLLLLQIGDAHTKQADTHWTIGQVRCQQLRND